MFRSEIPQLKVFRLWSIKLARTKTALSLATGLMTKTGYPPNTIARGIVQWEDEKYPDHICNIWFRSYRGVRFTGYVGINACGCKKPQPLQRIADDFEKEIIERGLFASAEEQLFNVS